MSRKLSGVLIQHKTGTAAQWTSVNPTLAKGEIGFETDTAKMKIGDGVTTYNNLPYLQAQAGESVGHVQYQYTVENGYIALDGSEVSRSTYSALWDWCQNKGLTTSDQMTNPQLFGTGDGSTTFRVPNFIDRVLQGGSTVSSKSAGLPEITGIISGISSNQGGNAGNVTVSGAFSSTGIYGGYVTNSNSTNSSACLKISMNASNSNMIYGTSETVQPPAIVLIPQIKY